MFLFLAFVNPELVCQKGGLSTIFKNVLECQQFPRINESLLATVLYMLNQPKTRHLIPSDIGIEVKHVDIKLVICN